LIVPLRSGYSKQSIDANIAELRRAGHSRDSAIFIAYAMARKSWFATHPRGHLIYELAWPKSARRKQDYDKDGRPVATESALQSVRTNPVAKGNTQINRILESDATPRIKILRLQNLALRTYASSPRQKEVIAAYKALEAQIADNPRTAAPDVTRATALYRGFTGKAPKVLKKINVPPLPETALAIGKVFVIMYSVDATGERFHHEFVGKARPLLIVAADGRQVFLSGGAYTFTNRGFVDKK